MRPPTATVSSSGCGAKTMTRALARAGRAARRRAARRRRARDGRGSIARHAAASATPAHAASTAQSTATRSPPVLTLRRAARQTLYRCTRFRGDHKPLDLVGALADDHERGVAVVALDAELLRVAVAAEDAHRLERHLLAGLGGEQLRHAGLEVAALAAVLHGGRPAGEEARRLDLGRHVGELQLDRLVLADRLAEGRPLLRVADRVLEGGLRDADGARRRC